MWWRLTYSVGSFLISASEKNIEVTFAFFHFPALWTKYGLYVCHVVVNVFVVNVLCYRVLLVYSRLSCSFFMRFCSSSCWKFPTTKMSYHVTRGRNTKISDKEQNIYPYVFRLPLCTSSSSSRWLPTKFMKIKMQVPNSRDTHVYPPAVVWTRRAHFCCFLI